MAGGMAGNGGRRRDFVKRRGFAYGLLTRCHLEKSRSFCVGFLDNKIETIFTSKFIARIN